MFDIHGSRGKVASRAAGCRVLSGTLERSAMFRVVRGHRRYVVWEGTATSLRHFKDDVPRIEKGQECGVILDGFDDLMQGDLIQCYCINKEQEKLIIDGNTVRLSGESSVSNASKNSK